MTEYGRQSLWRDTAAADAATARDLARRLELRGTAEDEIDARRAYLDLLGVSAGDRALDVGCGTGVVTRELARRVGAQGRAIGVDPSPSLLAVARQLAQEQGLGDRVEFREGSALRAPFPDGSFDVVLCVTVLSHVPGGEGAIPELARLLRPGGRLGVFDLDTDMTAVTHPGFFPLETAPRSFYGELADRCAEAALKAGAITEVERDGWLRALNAERARGPVLAGRLHIFVWARKPA